MAVYKAMRAVSSVSEGVDVEQTHPNNGRMFTMPLSGSSAPAPAGMTLVKKETKKPNTKLGRKQTESGCRNVMISGVSIQDSIHGDVASGQYNTEKYMYL